MPAINLSRLRKQTNALVEVYLQPKVFLSQLTDLFEFYSDRTIRLSDSIPQTTLIPSFSVPPPLIRRIRMEIYPLIEEHPKYSLTLAKLLWEKPALEFRQLATDILGHLPLEMKHSLIRTFLAWDRENDEEEVRLHLANAGLKRLREEDPDAFLIQIHRWVTHRDPQRIRIGLLSLHEGLQEISFDNLPKIFKMLSICIKRLPFELRSYFLPIIPSLVKISPQETAFFLRETYQEAKDTRLITWLIRNSLQEFPTHIQVNFKPMLSKR